MTTHVDKEVRPTKTSRAARPERVPVNGNRDILTVRGKDDSFIYRWVNDTNDRLLRFQEAGYQFVHDEDLVIGVKGVGSTIDATSSRIIKPVGGGVNAVLMQIPREWYDEDQKDKQQRITEIETTMRQEAMEGNYGKLEINR